MQFRDQIQQLSGHNANLCFQCSKCSAGCPMADKMDLKPAQVMHAIRLGLDDLVLNSEAIWLCVGCETCTERCPQQVNPAAALNAARALAFRRGIRPAVKEVGIYYRSFLGSMWMYGQIHDASVVAITRLLTGKIFHDLPLAWKLLRRGRLTLPPLLLKGGNFRRLSRHVLSKEA